MTRTKPNTTKGDTKMTNTHLSHLGLEMVGQTASSVVLSGTLANCKRIAAAHGMEVERYEGRIVSCDAGHAVFTPVDENRPNRIWYIGGGMIQRGRDDYSVVIPQSKWNQPV